MGDLASKTEHASQHSNLIQAHSGFFLFPHAGLTGQEYFLLGYYLTEKLCSSILLLKYWLGTRSKSKHEARHQPLEAGEAEGLGWETATARWGTGNKTKGGTHTKQPTHTPRGRTKWILWSFAQGKGYSASHPAAEAQLLSPSGQQGGKGKARSTFWLAKTNNYSQTSLPPLHFSSAVTRGLACHSVILCLLQKHKKPEHHPFLWDTRRTVERVNNKTEPRNMITPTMFPRRSSGVCIKKYGKDNITVSSIRFISPYCQWVPDSSHHYSWEIHPSTRTLQPSPILS